MIESLIPILILLIIIAFIIWMIIRLKKNGIGSSVIIHGAMYETYNKDKRSAVHQVLEQNVNKMQEQENDKPIE